MHETDWGEVDRAVVRVLFGKLFCDELTGADVDVATDVVHFWASDPSDFEFKSEDQRMLAVKIATRRKVDG